MVSSSYPVEGASALAADPELVQITEPPRSARWLYVMVLAFCFMGLQLGIGIPVILYMMSTQSIETEAQILAFSESPEAIMINVLAAGFAGIVTIIVAFIWPVLWNKLGGQRYSIEEWMAWRKPRYLPAIAAFILSPIILTAISFPIVQYFGDAEVDAQLDWFSTTTLQIAAGLMAVIVAPFAEEALFRGALYNALLGRSSTTSPQNWTRHILPVVVVTLSFAAVHLLAGFERIGSIMLILALSLYLTLLRTFTGSIRTTVAAHMAWNSLAVVLIVAEKLGVF